MTERFVSVAALADVPEGEARVFEVEERKVLLSKVEGQIYAVENVCSHDDGPLGEGTLEGHAIVCPRHGARFDIRDGSVLSMPAAFPIRSYPTRIEKDQVLVDLGSG